MMFSKILTESTGVYRQGEQKNFSTMFQIINSLIQILSKNQILVPINTAKIEIKL